VTPNDFFHGRKIVWGKGRRLEAGGRRLEAGGINVAMSRACARPWQFSPLSRHCS
jgi:hypothetical protein